MPRTTTLLMVALVTLVAPRGAAQTAATPCPYEMCAIRHTFELFGERLVRGEASEEVLKINFSGSNAVDFLSRVEAAAGPARDFRTRRVRSVVLGFLAGAASAYFVTSSLEGDGGLESEFDTPATVSLAAGVILGIWGGVEATRSRNSLSRAVWEFNRTPIR